ncbi:hypothetical protein JCGZ_03571 [Jatropha curcas]|uniref:Uncharacterized protein n=1 Tax=Jatropha curcas TaxID=180498 RepID=A0A067LAA3_JATCU|nr:hypothetical protein JCGZ_03571 [Jatropha curcas]
MREQHGKEHWSTRLELKWLESQVELASAITQPPDSLRLALKSIGIGREGEQ